MELILKEPEIKDLAILPHVALVDEKNRMYHLYNRLSEKAPSIIFMENDEKQMGRVAFSCFVDDFKVIPRYTTDEKGVSTWMWHEIDCPGIFKLKSGENLHVEVPVKNGDKTDAGVAVAKVKPGVVLMDQFTMSVLEGTDMQFIVSDSNALKLERVTFRETDDGFEERQKFRRNMIIRLNAMVERNKNEQKIKEN